MQGLLLSYRDFVATIEMSRLPHILLEGSHDKAFFTRMCEAALSGLPQNHVAITTAEELKSDGSVLGNRDKVEKVCELIEQSPFQYRFLGFVDREFRDFTLRESICDELRTHRCQGRLVWSRGHSIENYMFDFEVIKQPFLDFSINDEIGMIALGLLQEQFLEIMRIACALGIVALQQDQLGVVRRTVGWKTMQLSDGKFQWDIDTWTNELVERSDLTDSSRVNLVDGFQRWYDVAKMSAPDDVRWACDGHIGFKLIWAAYARAISDIADTVIGIEPKSTNQRDAILGIKDTAKFNHLTRNWTTNRGGETNDSPIFCLDMVGISN